MHNPPAGVSALDHTVGMKYEYGGHNAEAVAASRGLLVRARTRSIFSRKMTMARFYVVCPSCHRRMRLIGTSLETCGQPPIPVERYYRYPNCGSEWTYNVERNLQNLGVPAHVTQPGYVPLQ